MSCRIDSFRSLWILLALLACALSAPAQDDLSDHKRKLRDLQPEIDKAIDTGVEFLLSQQLRDGSWSFLKNEFPNGQTALAVYTLLKCDLPAHHPAVVRGLAFLERNEPLETYSIACQIMAMQASGREDLKPKIEKLTKELLRWGKKGAWGYPQWRSDLSNTQYAALGLRAAHLAGVKIPKKTLVALIKAALENQEKAEPAKLPPVPDGVDPKPTVDTYGRTPSGLEYGKERRKRQRAGFFYERGSMRTPTGSMTTAGLGIVLICNSILGDSAPRALRLRMSRAVQQGLNWFRINWAVNANPGMGSQHHHYYLYGLERLGSLLAEEIIADHPWYYEGARWLVKNQEKEGSWVDDQGNPFAPAGGAATKLREHVTCFGLLFLKRATRGGEATGAQKQTRGYRKYSAEAAATPVRMKGAGDSELSVWISGFGEDTRKRYEDQGGLRVLRVEYFVDETSIGVVKGDPARPWTIAKFPLKYTFTDEGEFRVYARVDVAGADAEGKPLDKTTVEAQGFTATIDAALQEWMLEEVAARGRNLLHPPAKRERFDPSKPPKQDRKKPLFRVTTSSSRNADEGAAMAADDRPDTHWICSPNAAKPRLEFTMRKGIKTNAIRISPACRHKGEIDDFDRVTQVEISINGDKNPVIIPLSENPLASTLYRLPKRTAIKRLRITIVGRRPSKKNPGCAGFTEIALE